MFMHPVQVKIYREMSPAKKLEIAVDMYNSARELKTVAMRQQHPEWTEKEVLKKVRDIFLYASS